MLKMARTRILVARSWPRSYIFNAALFFTRTETNMASNNGASASIDMAKAGSQNSASLAMPVDARPVVEVGTTPRVHKKGPLRIGDARIMAFVLTDKRRMLSGRSVTNALGLTGRGMGIGRILNSESLQPYISDRLRDALENPVLFTVSSGLPLAMGYEAWVLPEVCHTIVDAFDKQALHPLLAKTVANAKKLIRGFSTVGIIALIDEATGFQEERERDALQELLSLYISDRLLPWAQTFPPSFYKEIFRLRGWNWDSINNKRPRLVGKLTKNIIYERISPDLLRVLEGENPVMGDGRRRRKHSQRLTEDYGKPALRIHREVVEGLMRASRTWDGFMTLLERAYPLKNQQLTFNREFEEGE
jgi:hypothetical protein